MQVNDEVVCVYGTGSGLLTTHRSYIVVKVHKAVDDFTTITVNTLAGEYVGTFAASRFMLKSDIVKQVMENARNDR